MTDEQKNAIDHAQKILRAVKLYSLAEALSAAPATPIGYLPVEELANLAESSTWKRVAIYANDAQESGPVVPIYAAPATILALLDEIDALKKDKERIDKLDQQIDSPIFDNWREYIDNLR